MLCMFFVVFKSETCVVFRPNLQVRVRLSHTTVDVYSYILIQNCCVLNLIKVRSLEDVTGSHSLITGCDCQKLSWS